MIKKILTTKAHLVVLFLGMVNSFLIPQLLMWGTYDLNRTIGWGWDLSNYFWYYDWYLNILWGILFSLIYWLIEKKHLLFFPLILLQIIVIILLMISRWIDPAFRVYLEITNWLIFFINILAAFMNKKIK